MRWKHPRELVEKLHKMGFSYRRIARECGCEPSAIVRLAHGQVRMPRIATENKIIELYSKYVRRK